MRQRNITKVFLFKKTTIKTDEARVINNYSGNGEEIIVCVWPASSYKQSQVYGQEINEILNMISDYDIDVDDGIALDSTEPNYIVISKKSYTNHKWYELKKL